MNQVFPGNEVAVKCHNYYRDLRRKHFVHDESSYHQCLVAAAINDGSKQYKVERVVAVSLAAGTHTVENTSNLRSLIMTSLNWLESRFTAACDAVTANLEKLSYEELKAQGDAQFRVPTVEDVSITRGQS